MSVRHGRGARETLEERVARQAQEPRQAQERSADRAPSDDLDQLRPAPARARNDREAAPPTRSSRNTDKDEWKLAGESLLTMLQFTAALLVVLICIELAFQ